MPNRFTATSPTGDLADALRAAIAAATRSLNTNFFTWHLESIRGTVGGFVGAHDVTVSIEAEAPGGAAPESSSARAQAFAVQRRAVGHEVSGEWYAWHDRMPGKRATLHVTGICVFPTGGYKAQLRPTVPQGVVPSIYLLDLIIEAPTGSAPDVITEVPVHYREVTDAVYTDVLILPDNTLVPVHEVS